VGPNRVERVDDDRRGRMVRHLPGADIAIVSLSPQPQAPAAPLATDQFPGSRSDRRNRRARRQLNRAGHQQPAAGRDAIRCKLFVADNFTIAFNGGCGSGPELTSTILPYNINARPQECRLRTSPQCEPHAAPRRIPLEIVASLPPQSV